MTHRRRPVSLFPASGPGFLLLLSTIAALLCRAALLLRPADLFNARPVIEDAWYALTVARWLGHGAGMSADGIHATNGVQPLIVLLYAPLYAVFSDGTALRLAFVVCVLMEAALWRMAWRLVRAMWLGVDASATDASPADGPAADVPRRAAAYAVLLLQWTFSTTVYTLNGLETALASVLCIASVLHWRRVTGGDAPRMRDLITSGALMGLAVLARIDSAFLVVVFAGMHVSGLGASRALQAGAPSTAARTRIRFPLRLRLLHVAVAGTAALAVSAPWWIYNVSTFGHLTPTSGLSQRLVIPYAENLGALVQVLLNALLLIGHIPYRQALGLPHVAAAGALGAVVLCVMLVPPMRRAVRVLLATVLHRWDARAALPLLLFTAALAAYYVLDFGAPHFLQRYLFLVHVLAVCGAAILVAEIRMRISDIKNPGARPSASQASIARGLVERFPPARVRQALMLGALLMLAVPFVYTYAWNFSETKAQENDFLQVSTYIGRCIPPTDRIGMGQSGTAGYFHPNVTNLDGKVNAAVFTASRDGRLCAYIDSARFDWLIDWQHFFDRLAPCGMLSHYARVDSVGRFLVYRRVEAVR